MMTPTNAIRAAITPMGRASWERVLADNRPCDVGLRATGVVVLTMLFPNVFWPATLRTLAPTT